MIMIYDDLGRPDWNFYFMTLALLASQRSLDPHTKHGTVVIDDDRTILSIGYNGPPRHSIDENVPLTRPEKYDWMVHSESAAIINAARSGIPLKGSTFYITGHPCEKCMREMINVGAKKIIYGPIGSKVVSKHTVEIVLKMLDGQDMYFSSLADIFCTTDNEVADAIGVMIRGAAEYLSIKQSESC